MAFIRDYKAFRLAAERGHVSIVHRLFRFSSVFAYADSHHREYDIRYIASFVVAQLKVLRERPEISDSEEAKLCFYIVRYLIRSHDPARLHDIQFLMNFSSVKALLHTTVTPNQPNELLRLALSIGNQAAAEILLMIPAVHELARENDYYWREAQGDLDLRDLARNDESSMTALTLGEQKRLEGALKIYQPLIEQRGTPALIQTLRDELKARYEAHPAKVHMDDGDVIDLPFTWESWCELRKMLSTETQALGLQAYYQHQDHTAWRYLAKPNPWMAEDATYVDHDDAGGWSTFEDYQPLIALFYLGACDTNIVPCDGHTFETRLEHFIDELAHIGRAHNWDTTRSIIDASGDVVTEEYDDLQGDKPSCYSGVKRRLFQSVLGHPLLKILTMDDIKQELRDYVREHFKQCILNQPHEAMVWSKAWTRICETGCEHEALSGMNISEADQNKWIEALGVKYSYQFDKEMIFKAYIQERFRITQYITTHAAQFGGETDLTSLLEPCGKQKQDCGEKSDEKCVKSSTESIFKPAYLSSSGHECYTTHRSDHTSSGEKLF